MKKVIILGAGVSGCVAAKELMQKGYQVTLFEKEAFLGGGCHTFFYGGHPYTEGPRPLTMSNPKVVKYIEDIVPLRTFPLLLDTYIERDRAFYSYPIHWDDIQLMPDKDKILQELEDRPENNNADNLEDGWINAVGETLYDKYVKTYTQKMWMVESNKLFKDHTWTVKGSPIQTGDRVCHLAENPLHAYPLELTGYNRFFEWCVDGAEVHLNTPIQKCDLNQKKVWFEDQVMDADIIISTISLDDLCGHCFGELRYMGREFKKIVLPSEHIFKKEHHFMYYPNNEEFTRIVEYKNLTGYQSDSSLLVMEIPSKGNRLYSYKIESEQEKAKKYLETLPADVYALGRLGTYQYMDITNCIEAVWNLMKQF